MLCILSKSDNPYFNLAAEEYLLKTFTEDIFLLYRNRASIVVGKHQNTLAEINLPFVQEKEIMVARRISGGGTVYHDEGNLNFAFFRTGEEGSLVDYKKATKPIIDALNSMGLKASLGKRNELLLKGKKISGTASHVFKKRVLHHGTLLFSSEMKHVSQALLTDQKPFTDRAVKSVPSQITNISDHLPRAMQMAEFRDELFDYVKGAEGEAEVYDFTEEDLSQIRELRDSRFSTWEWNFGYSPRYEFSKTVVFEGGQFDLKMNVEKGLIREMKIEGDFLSGKDIRSLEDLLRGTIHDPETIRLKLDEVDLGEYMEGLKLEDLVLGMF